MTVYIALLQGINVGKKKRISMVDLRALVSASGGDDVATLVNSGNVIYKADRDLASIIESEIEAHIGVPVPVISRTRAHLDAIIANNPYPEAASEPKSLHVDFLESDVPGALNDLGYGDDHLTIHGREIYLHLPTFMSGITYDAKTLGKRLGNRHTSRNWSTVTKLREIAANLDQ